jgi:hypothetical protein
MNLVAGEASSRPSLRPVDRALRVRPAEVPVWVDLRISAAEGRAWRARAAARRLGLDAWLGVLVEFTVVLETTPIAYDAVMSSVDEAATQTRLAPTPAFRRWARLLGGQESAVLPRDELPTVVLPERVVAQVPAASLFDNVSAAVEHVDEDVALRADSAAATRGLTLESWLLRTALAATAR